MQQTSICPSCGSPIVSSQKFCGVCGLNLAGMAQQKTPTCPTCGTQVVPGQQFCGTCGTNLASLSPQQAPMAQAVPTAAATPRGAPTMVAGAPTVPATAPAAPAAAAKPVMARPRKHRILTIAAVIFQIVGWIVLVFGILVSLFVGVWTGLGGGIQSLIPGMGTLGGTAAIGMAIGGIIASLICGFGYLAFAEICYTLIDIDKDLTRLK